MKLYNEDFTKQDYIEMGKALVRTISICERALKYGEDMRSSRMSVLRDAKATLAALVYEMDEPKPFNG